VAAGGALAGSLRHHGASQRPTIRPQVIRRITPAERQAEAVASPALRYRRSMVGAEIEPAARKRAGLNPRSRSSRSLGSRRCRRPGRTFEIEPARPPAPLDASSTCMDRPLMIRSSDGATSVRRLIMKGLIFTEFLEMVEAKFSPEMLDRILERAELPSGGAYTAVGTYDHTEMVELVTCLGRETGIPTRDLVCSFGTHLFERFHQTFPMYFVGIGS